MRGPRAVLLTLMVDLSEKYQHIRTVRRLRMIDRRMRHIDQRMQTLQWIEENKPPWANRLPQMEKYRTNQPYSNLPLLVFQFLVAVTFVVLCALSYVDWFGWLVMGASVLNTMSIFDGMFRHTVDHGMSYIVRLQRKERV